MQQTWRCHDLIRRHMPADGVVGDSETALFVGPVQPHVDTGPVLFVPCLVGVSGVVGSMPSV
jgi:hypothetical protein